MKPFVDLDSLGKKARKASGRIRCDKCPAYTICRTNTVMHETCTYIFEHAYRSGYNQRKKEEQ